MIEYLSLRHRLIIVSEISYLALGPEMPDAFQENVFKLRHYVSECKCVCGPACEFYVTAIT